MKRWMEIRLCSDLCVSNGESYSAWIDNDVCYDDYGLPIILAKRLKGCIREIALELADWGGCATVGSEKILITEELIDRIFGAGGEQNGTVRLSNGTLKEYSSYIREIESSPYKMYLSPQNVLDTFTYVRAQTAIDPASGVAKSDTLRFTRVVKKGIEFIFSYELEDEREAAVFETAAMALKRIGLNRSRGLGEITIYPMKTEESIETETMEEIRRYHQQLQKVKEKLELMGTKKAVIQYFLWADTELLFPTGQNGDRVTESYIPGANMMGFLAWEYQKQGGSDFFSLFQSGNVQFKNAYVSDGKHRYYPACCCYFTDKDIESTNCYNYMKKPEKERFQEPAEGRVGRTVKRESMAGKYTYVAFKNGMEAEHLYVISVDTQWNSHVRRIDEQKLYQFSSINSRQCFTGEIVGRADYLKKLTELFPEDRIFRLGRSASTQYGLLSMLQLDVEPLYKKEETFSSKFMLEFISPVILFNKKTLTFQTTETLLKETLANCWEIDQKDIKLTEQGYQYRTYGGFNRKWQLHKPQVQAFDKGTSFLVELRNPISLEKVCYKPIGERTVEGFGELYAVDYGQMRDCYEIKVQPARMSIKEKAVIQGIESGDILSCREENGWLMDKVAKRLIKEQLELNAMKEAKKHGIPNATMIGKLNLLVKQCASWQEFFQQIFWIKDKEKKCSILAAFQCKKEEEREAQRFLENIRQKACEGRFEAFIEQYSLNEVYQTYMRAYFRQAKYEERREN